MKLFLFQRVKQVSESYHPEGGLVIVANDHDHAHALIADMEDIQPTDSEWAESIIYELQEAFEHNPKPVVYVFPDAGCC